MNKSFILESKLPIVVLAKKNEKESVRLIWINNPRENIVNGLRKNIISAAVCMDLFYKNTGMSPHNAGHIWIFLYSIDSFQYGVYMSPFVSSD